MTLILICDLGDEQERRVYALIGDLLVCQADKESTVLVGFHQLDPNLDVPWKKEL